MMGDRFNRYVQAQLAQLLREDEITSEQHAEVASRYPVTRWDWLSLGRWFLVFGSLSLASGLILFIRELFDFTLIKMAWVLAITMGGFMFAAWRFELRGWQWSTRSSELVAGLLLVALTFTLGVIYSTGSGNWPALLLIDWLILLPLAYVRHNPLLLVLSLVLIFTWFGGVTGYVSGWGAYYFGMNYPLRFLMLGTFMVGLSLAHRQVATGWLGQRRDFFKFWLSSGLFFMEMALWLLSLFGNFEWGNHRHHFAGELWLFNLLWIALNAYLIWLGAKTLMPMLRGYGVTFAIIQAYTLYFWHVASHLGPILGTAVAGVSALALMKWLEQKRKESKAGG